MDIPTVVAQLHERGSVLRQNHAEFQEVFDLVKAKQPNVLVEIGSLYGSSLQLLGNACAPGALIIGIEPNPKHTVLFSLAQLSNQGYQPLFIRRPSATALSVVMRSLKGRKIDVLHVDDSLPSFENYMAHWTHYSSLMAKDGLLLFHDVANPNCSGVMRAWEQIKRGRSDTRVIAHDSELWTKPGAHKCVGYGVVELAA